MSLKRWTLCLTDGLVSYNAPVGEQMNFPAYPVYVNDSVYDGAVIHRYVCFSIPSFPFSTTLLHHSCHPLSVLFPLTLLLPGHHGESKETDGSEWVMVVYCSAIPHGIK